jgi:hypothetical protein
MLKEEIVHDIANKLIRAASNQLQAEQIGAFKWLNDTECEYNSAIMALLDLSSCGDWKLPKSLFHDVEIWGESMKSWQTQDYRRAANQALIIYRGSGININN